MKQITSGPDATTWNAKLIDQIGFIKKHLRYPVSKWTGLLIVAWLPVVAAIIYLVLFTKPNSKGSSVYVFVLLFLTGIITAITATNRFLQTLRFNAVPTQYFTADNIILLQYFLKAHHFAVARHPEAPEVFQIMSKSISALQDEREIVIFIADDHRILINSHFTQIRKFRMNVGEPHHREIVRMLTRWLDAHRNTPSAEVVHQAF